MANQNVKCALLLFVVELVVAWAINKAIYLGDIAGVFALLVTFIAGLLFLLHLRREDLRQHTWCEARR